MATRIMLPCDGYSPAWEWLSVWQLEALQDWWGTSAHLARESVRGPIERTPDGAVADAVSDAVRAWEDERAAEAAMEFGDV